MSDNGQRTIDVTDESFERDVLQSETPVVVDFWAPWCGPCKMIGPVLESLAESYEGRLTIAKVNTDEHAQRAGEYNVMGIPTLLFVAGGEVVDRLLGAQPRAELESRVERFLAEVAA